MINNRKVIGACISELHGSFKSEQLEILNREIMAAGYKLIIFNSLSNLYDSGPYDNGSLSVFRKINFDIIDCLIIFDKGFTNKQIGDELVAAAREKNVPVVIVNGEVEGCYCIVEDFKTSYKNLIRHVIKDHNARDTFFMGGYRWNQDSLDRLACYKKALGEENINFDESMVGYGEFWDKPAIDELNHLLENRENPPQAIICANDCMAMAVCTRLKELGYNVPNDVIVTGFDGIEEGRYFIPNITTIRENVEGEAMVCAEVVKEILEGGKPKKVTKVPYRVIYNESCGCESEEDFGDYRNKMAECMRKNRNVSGHETFVFEGVDKFLACDSLPEMLDVLAKYNTVANSYMLINSMLLESINIMYKSNLNMDFSKEYLVFSSESEEEFGLMDVNFDSKQMIPEIDEWLEDDSVCIINSLYVEDYQYGMFVYKTDKIEEAANFATRFSRALNLSFATVYNRMIQKGMQMELEETQYIDTFSQFNNIKGLDRWFKTFAKNEESHQKMVSLILFKISKFRYIYDNFGTAENEAVIQIIADILSKFSSSYKCAGRSSDDEFVLLGYSENEDIKEYNEKVEKLVNEIMTAVENFNAMHLKKYSIELNTGHTIISKGWDTDLRSLIKLAYGEMYLKAMGPERNNFYKSVEGSDMEDHYQELMVVLEKKLLTYHFQPIIDSKSGEIYAYEALMRTIGGVKLTPPQLLATAAKYDKLYELEKMTLFGIMDYFVANFEKFNKRRVFINSIPGYFLNDDDFKIFVEKFKPYLEYCVFEITEQDSITDSELSKIKTLTIDETKAQFAVDDYGSGQSNIENLLRYSPNIVKIDRFLIQDIYKEPNKQLFISNIIEFAKLNNMRVVGEGVETIEELKTILDYGVDYIQGFYTARPGEEPLDKLPKDVHEAVTRIRG